MLHRNILIFLHYCRSAGVARLKRINPSVKVLIGLIRGRDELIWIIASMYSHARRTKLINTIVAYLNTHNLDGLDIDFEYGIDMWSDEKRHFCVFIQVRMIPMLQKPRVSLHVWTQLVSITVALFMYSLACAQHMRTHVRSRACALTHIHMRSHPHTNAHLRQRVDHCHSSTCTK